MQREDCCYQRGRELPTAEIDPGYLTYRMRMRRYRFSLTICQMSMEDEREEQAVIQDANRDEETKREAS